VGMMGRASTWTEASMSGRMWHCRAKFGVAMAVRARQRQGRVSERQE